MGGGSSRPAEQPVAPQQAALQSKDQNTTPRSNKKVSMFWKRKFQNADSVPWVEFIEGYKSWLRDTFPDVLDDEEFDNLMSEEAEKALRHVLCYRKGHRKPGKMVTLQTLGATYPTGPDLFLCTKQLISRSIRQYTQDMRMRPPDDDENEVTDRLSRRRIVLFGEIWCLPFAFRSEPYSKKTLCPEHASAVCIRVTLRGHLIWGKTTTGWRLRPP